MLGHAAHTRGAASAGDAPAPSPQPGGRVPLRSNARRHRTRARCRSLRDDVAAQRSTQAPAPVAISFRARYPADPRDQVPVVPWPGAARVAARPEHARGRPDRRRPRRRAGAGKRRAEPAVPHGRRARPAGDADAGHAARSRRDRGAEEVDRRGRQVGRRRGDDARPPPVRRWRWRIDRSPPRSVATGRSSCRCRRPLPMVDRQGFHQPDRSLPRKRRASSAA